jgi:hypothetical protein
MKKISQLAREHNVNLLIPEIGQLINSKQKYMSSIWWDLDKQETEKDPSVALSIAD